MAKDVEKTIRETALANSTFAAAILQLSQMCNSAETSGEHITIYNSIHECLSTSIASLELIQANFKKNNEGNMILICQSLEILLTVIDQGDSVLSRLLRGNPLLFVGIALK